MEPDRVVLTVPGTGAYAKTVRMTAAQLAILAGMTYDEVDDVRMAAEEAFVFASDCIAPDESIDFTFSLTDGALVIDVGPLRECDDAKAHRAASEGYAEFILRSVCDEFSIEQTETGGSLRLVHFVAADREGLGA